MAYDSPATPEIMEKTVAALRSRGFEALAVENGAAARDKLLSLVPEDAEVMSMTSRTLDTLEIPPVLNGYPRAVRPRLGDSALSPQEKKKLGSAPEIAVGSVHAVTQDGRVLLASASGSQLPAHIFGAGKVIWIVGSQKIVPDVESGQKRIEEYVFPLEDARAQQAYGRHSAINYLLIMNASPVPGRITLILTPEKLGF